MVGVASESVCVRGICTSLSTDNAESQGLQRHKVFEGSLFMQCRRLSYRRRGRSERYGLNWRAANQAAGCWTSSAAAGHEHRLCP